MKKLICMLLVLVLAMGTLTGCSGTTVVYYSDCSCVCCTGSSTNAATGNTTESTGTETVQGAVKTGLAIVPTASGTSAAAEADGTVEFAVDYVAVTVDANGIITACVIDSLGTSVSFDTAGAITTDVTADHVVTKNELGPDYGMVAWGGAVAEWNEQAAALADYCVGKTIDQVLSGAINETGYAADADLATSATIYLGGYVAAIEEAVRNAVDLGAQSGDVLKLATINTLSDSAQGNAQLNSDVVALTMNGDTITSCVIDSLQAKVGIDETGAVTSDLSSRFQTKNQLGEAYGMVAWGGAIAEWNVQAASFASYVTGKTAAQVAGIAVDESTKTTDADLATSVTIAIGSFQNLIAKAAN